MDRRGVLHHAVASCSALVNLNIACAVPCRAVLCYAGGAGDEWVVLLASGIRGVGGAVLRFRSKHFTHGETGG